MRAADVGCGDGKYLDLKEMGNPTCVALGCDRSLRLLQLSNQGHDYEVMACDVLTVSRPMGLGMRKKRWTYVLLTTGVCSCVWLSTQLPYRSGAFDAAFCTAVLHHMSTEPHRCPSDMCSPMSLPVPTLTIMSLLYTDRE